MSGQGSMFSWRRRMVVGALMAGFLVLGGRVIDLQINHHEFLMNEANARHLRVVRMPAHRGMILDRHGEPLAISTPVSSIWIHPAELSVDKARWPELIKALDMSEGRLRHTIAQRGDREFVYLRRHADPALARKIIKLGIRGVYQQREYRRYYPHAEVSAHVVGITDIDERGREGSELAFDNWLTGRDGAKRVMRDRLGRIIEDVERIRAPRQGRELRLSIDQRLQYLAYRELKAAAKRHRARSASMVLIDVLTGEVLAVVNQPSYNPNTRRRGNSSTRRNRAITDVLEPGSTMKPFTIAIGLQSGQVQADSRIDTSPGTFKVGRHLIRDHRNYGTIDLATVIMKSSNVGVSRIALSVPPQDMWLILSQLGFGNTTGSGFPGESPGILRHYGHWGDIHRATLAYGYGLSVTPLQLAQAYVAIANDGLVQALSLQRVDRPGKRRRVLSEDVALAVRTMMEGVVGPGGTAGKAAIPGYRVAGKTGTVRKPIAGGYSEDRFTALFAGLAPASKPRLVGVVVIDEPGGEEYYGGQVAAPVFRTVMAGALRLLGVAPDRPQDLSPGPVARLARG
ncbi:MAG: penicillin-binding protein 2 [Gammaproteobacteria bacterium]|nr:penicillin-binding protein 2 [Gammaproteobacteria bacterium]